MKRNEQIQQLINKIEEKGIVRHMYYDETANCQCAVGYYFDVAGIEEECKNKLIAEENGTAFGAIDFIIDLKNGFLTDKEIIQLQSLNDDKNSNEEEIISYLKILMNLPFEDTSE